MDSLTAYASNHSSDDESPAATSPSPSPSTPPANNPVAVVTGTLHPLDLSDRHFSALHASFNPPVPNRNRIPNPPKRPRSQTPPPPLKRPNSKRKHSSKTSPPFIPSSTFHLPTTHDYQARPWHLPAPTALTFADLETYLPYIPKRPIATPLAHTRGVSVVRFAPHYGHLLLSAGFDNNISLWRSQTATLARVYHGHTKAVRDVVFDHNALHLLSASYDNSVLLWDVETGAVRSAFKTPANPLCVRFSPRDPSEFLVACADKKVLQIDVRDASRVVQTYDDHMGAVNSLAFVDDGRRFVTSADDKVLRVWEYGVPVVIKYVSDPSAHSMPVTLLHPNRKWLACQAMDNTVRLFSTTSRFKRNEKRIFRGHIVAGYRCGLATSPDGRFLVSGDSLGRLFFWDWKTARLLRTMQAHNGVCSAVDWHPTQPSFVVSCGWDGIVKFWD